MFARVSNVVYDVTYFLFIVLRSSSTCISVAVRALA